MINQLVLIFFLSFSLLFFPACTIFDSGDSGDSTEAEDYYDKEEEDVLAYEEDQPLSEGIDQDSDEEAEEPLVEIPNEESDEDFYYIDEEDEEDEVGGVGIVVNDEEIDSDTDSYNDASDSPSFFPSDKTSSLPAPKTKPAPALPAKKRLPYNKIKSQSYNVAGFLVNAVYIARPEENIQSISNTVFRSDQVDQLYAINPHLKARSVTVGDKIYYQSPNRPQDSSQLLFYFEDNSIQPNYYQAQAGDNIRTIASQLLGHSNSWKEIWATNPELESKRDLTESRTIKYWPLGSNNVQPTPPHPEQPALPPEENDNTDDFPPSPEPSVEPPTIIAPEPPQINGGQGDAPPPTGKKDMMMGRFSQTDIIIGGVLALFAVICIFIILKKKRKHKEFDYTTPNFEIDK